MRYLGAAILFALLAAAALVARGTTPPLPPYREIPVAQIRGKPVPQIGLVAPLPNWMPLPERGYVSGAELFPPQPPYGPAAVVMLRYDETQAQFVVDYRHRLARAGFGMRPILFPYHLVIDKPDAAYEADEKNGGRVGYVILRSGFNKRSAQLTFYEAPAPRMPF